MGYFICNTNTVSDKNARTITYR